MSRVDLHARTLDRVSSKRIVAQGSVERWRSLDPSHMREGRHGEQLRRLEAEFEEWAYLEALLESAESA